MTEIVLYTFAAVLVVSAISLIGVFFVSMRAKQLRSALILFVGLAIGALLGDAFLHLLPEASASLGVQTTAAWVLGGMLIFFVLEKFLHWHHAHDVHSEIDPDCEDCETEIKHPVGTLVIFSDILHNVIDGVIIAAGFLIAPEVGIATTIAVALHEIPQEISDFGVMLHAGWSKGKALLANFASALSAFVGAGLVLFLGNEFNELIPVLSAVAGGGFIYIAMADLVPELHKRNHVRTSVLQLLFVFVGVGLMFGLGFVEGENHQHDTAHEAHQEEHVHEEEHESEEVHHEHEHEAPDHDQEAAVPAASVIRIIDGDTVVVRQPSGAEETVRLIGVDAPEVNKNECYARESTMAMNSILPIGTHVRIKSDPTQDVRDVYGRLLAYVFLENGVSVGEQMIVRGAAREYTYRDNVYQYQTPHLLAEEEAQLEGRGLWSACEN